MGHDVLLKKNPRMAMRLKYLVRLNANARETIATPATAHRNAQL